MMKDSAFKLKKHLQLTKKSLLHALITLLGGGICWYALRWMGVPDPIWGIITVMLVSDVDSNTTASLAKTRVINTVVGCLLGLLSLVIFGYSPEVLLLTAAATILFVTSYAKYPSNWRLAPATVVILMDAARQAAGHAAQLDYALMRAGEIGFGSVIALSLSYLYGYAARLRAVRG